MSFTIFQVRLIYLPQLSISDSGQNAEEQPAIHTTHSPTRSLSCLGGTRVLLLGYCFSVKNMQKRHLKIHNMVHNPADFLLYKESED